MANEFIARNGLIALNNSQITGSLNVSAGITGSLLGTASYATQALSASFASTASLVNVISTVNNTAYYLTGVDSDNGTQSPEQLYTFGPTFNPDTNTLTVPGQVNSSTFFGALSGNATTATSATTVNTVTAATNYEYFPTFVDADNGSASPEAVYTDAGIKYNPSTNILTTTASFAATAATASKVITGTAGSGIWYPTFGNSSNTNATQALSTNNTFQYNGATNVLTVPNITSTVTTASYALYASQSGYTMQFVLATTGSNPAAGVTYRMGAPVRNQLSVTAGRNRIYVPRPGKVKYAHVYVRTNGQLASAGTSTLALNKNTAFTETIGTSAVIGLVADATVVSTSAISMSVVQGDYLEIYFTTPAWGTLPTGVEANAIIYIENNLT